MKVARSLCSVAPLIAAAPQISSHHSRTVVRLYGKSGPPLLNAASVRSNAANSRRAG